MVDNIVELENNRKYIILEEQILDNKKYYFGLRLDDNEVPMNIYLFFQESKMGDATYLYPVDDEKLKGILLTAFTVNYLDKAYDEV